MREFRGRMDRLFHFIQLDHHDAIAGTQSLSFFRFFIRLLHSFDNDVRKIDSFESRDTIDSRTPFYIGFGFDLDCHQHRDE